MTEATKQVDELTLLKKRADTLGITYRENIGIETLKSRINEKLNENENKEEAKEEAASKIDYRAQKIKEANKLIRVNITSMNPAKRDIPGAYYTTGNKLIGTIRKWIPHGGEVAEAGYHIPQALLNVLKNMTFTQTKTERDDKGRPFIKKVVRKEFSIQILEPLTQEELDALGRDQRAGNRI